MTNLNKKSLPTAPEGASTREVSAVSKESAPALSYLFIYKRKKTDGLQRQEHKSPASVTAVRELWHRSPVQEVRPLRTKSKATANKKQRHHEQEAKP